jgi:myo-inositol-1(or 4)-monophosphatase
MATCRRFHDVGMTCATLRTAPVVVKRALCYASPPMSPSFRAVAVDAATRAGTLLRSHLGGRREISHKNSPINLVTDMDRRAESLIIDAIALHFPTHAILAEEGGVVLAEERGNLAEERGNLAEERGVLAEKRGILAEERGTRVAPTHRWIVDPLDGTTNYAHGMPIFCVSIALEIDGRLALGVVYDPNRDECFVAERGQGATVNGARLQVSTATALGESLLSTGYQYDIRHATRNNLPEHAAVLLRARSVREIGSAVLHLAYVAAGRLDGFWELSLGPWDVAAGALLVEEAGGRVTNPRGDALDLDAPSILATNGIIHDEVLRVLEEVRDR